MRYLYFVGLLLTFWLLIATLGLLDKFGYLILIMALMLTAGLILKRNENENARAIGWALRAAVVVVTILLIALLVWAGFKIIC